MSFEYTEIQKNEFRLDGRKYDGMMTPYFKHLNILNEQKSEAEGKPVYEMIEAVELRMPGDRHYVPVFRVDEMWMKDGNRIITYMERFQEQYRQFLANEDQVVEGTPLENLTPYGITPSQLSMCRALKIYSIESLYQLEGPNLKSLGAVGNVLKPMAVKYMDDRRDNNSMARRIAELESKLAEMANSIVVPKEVKNADEVVTEANQELFETMSEDELREYIFDKTQAKPDGRLKHASLVNMAKGI